MIANFKKIKFFFIVISFSSVTLMVGCHDKGNGNNQADGIANSQNESQSTPKIIDDNYVGTWMDITHDPTDTSETFTITQIHDYQYQVGALTGELKQVIDGTQYLSVWTQEGAEMQFIYDNYTKHLMMRTPFFSKELRKIN